MVNDIDAIMGHLDEAYAYWYEDGQAALDLDPRNVYYGKAEGLALALSTLRGTTPEGEMKASLARWWGRGE